ncbi:hypothetical protein QFZ35_002933 [Arthrobacter ulcerisalmonis]|nr:hypothetical protein [Arthrobacter ulcerisalmonis]
MGVVIYLFAAIIGAALGGVIYARPFRRNEGGGPWLHAGSRRKRGSAVVGFVHVIERHRSPTWNSCLCCHRIEMTATLY